MIKKIREKLIESARQGKFITYTELIAYLSLDIKYKRLQGGVLFEWLNRISRYEKKRGRPLLSAIVVRVDSRLPGFGFAKLLGKRNLDIDVVRQIQEECSKFWKNDKNLVEFINDFPRQEVPELQ
jgi:hypothetical protein